MSSCCFDIRVCVNESFWAESDSDMKLINQRVDLIASCDTSLGAVAESQAATDTSSGSAPVWNRGLMFKHQLNNIFRSYLHRCISDYVKCPSIYYL